VLRIGVPFALVVVLLMPLGKYPTYLQTAVDPGVTAFWRHWLALPFWPCGPMWFLWLLAGGRFCRRWASPICTGMGDVLIRFSFSAGARPMRYFAGLVIASALAYVPLAVAFTPSAWLAFGPFGFQLSRPLHYPVYFFVGVGIGAPSVGEA
jgi:glucan biosynthesis protein C